MTLPDLKKIYVRPDNTVVLTCPYCNHQREVRVSLFRGKRRLRVKCCDTFRVIVEFRRRIRKRTELSGSYINHSKDDREGNITIQDLSISGLAFTCFDHHLLEVEDELTLEFTLDDEYQSMIIKEVVVRNVRESTVGCEFTTGNELISPGPLGYYVMHVLP